VDGSRPRIRSALGIAGGLLLALVSDPTLTAAQTSRVAGTSAVDARWRASLERAESALANGQYRRAAEAWEEARRSAMRPTTPPKMLVDLGLVYLRIGEAAYDRRVAVSRARQLFLEALFRSRDRRDVEGITAVSRAFADLGDCEVARRVFALGARFSPTPVEPPRCERREVGPEPSASPRPDVIDRRQLP
jgi:hypothetical protein